VDTGEIDVADVAGVIVVADLTARPVKAFDTKTVAGLDLGNHRQIGMPTIMDHAILVVGCAGQVDGDQGLNHSVPPGMGSCRDH